MFYVYTLIDPRTNKIFYVGKGTGNRVLLHKKFRSGCRNNQKDKVIKEILESHDTVPYHIVKEFSNENEAYDFEEKLIAEIGLKNLTNKTSSKRPPNQLSVKRSNETIKKIKVNSKKQGKERTIDHIVENSELFYNILTEINNNTLRSVVIKKLGITIDLYNKVKRKYSTYVSYLNNYTDYNVDIKLLKKFNGMQAKVFYENQEVLKKMYKMINESKKRRHIVKELGITNEFYDRMKNKEKDFIKYFNTELV